MELPIPSKFPDVIELFLDKDLKVEAKQEGNNLIIEAKTNGEAKPRFLACRTYAKKCVKAIVEEGSFRDHYASKVGCSTSKAESD